MRLEGAREREAPQRPDEQKAEAKYHGHKTQNGGMTGRRASKERDGGTEGRMEGWREGGRDEGMEGWREGCRDDAGKGLHRTVARMEGWRE